MSSKIDQKEYLKKYLSGDVEKVKKKKKRPVTGQTVTIIDDDVDVSKMEHLRQEDVEILATGEDAPQVVGVIDERPPELRAQDFKNSSKWKIFADDNGFAGFETPLTVQQVDRKSGRIEKSSGAAVESKKKSSSKRNKSPDLSPVRRRRASSTDSSPQRKKSPDLSPKRKRNSRSTSKRGISPPKRTRSSTRSSTNGSKSSDLSPKRRRSSNSDLSPKRKSPHYSPRRKRSPGSPQRRRMSPESPQRRRRSQDSPPRRGKSAGSPPKRRGSPYSSPPRRRRSPDSPPRRRNYPESSPKRWRSPGSPPRRRRSPFQQEHNRSGDFSSGWKKGFSPKRFGRPPNESQPFRRDDKRNSFNAPYRNRNSSPDAYRNRGRGNSPKNWNQDRGFDRGNDRGFNRGNDRGFNRGNDRGFDKGYDRGFNRGQDRGYDRGGHDRGFQHNTSNRGRDSFGWGGRGGRGGRGFDNRRNQNENFRGAQTYDRGRPREPTPEWSPVKPSASAMRNRSSPQSNRPSQYAPPTGAPYGTYNTRKSPGTSFDRGRPGPSRYRNDYSPKNREATPDWDESSPPRAKSPFGDKERKPTTREISPENTKMKKTLEGKTAGLQDAKSLRMESDKIRKRDTEAFNQMSDEVSGRNASMVMRDKRTGKIRDLEREAEKDREKDEKEQQKKDVYDRWGKGLKQVEDYKQKIDDDIHEMSKPLARYSDDADLDSYLKKQEREGDPMLEYMRQKEREKHKETKTATMPIYKGPYPENRLGIRPGYRWDGVDRSNGYEKKWFDVQNKKKAIQEEAYRYSTEDL